MPKANSVEGRPKKAAARRSVKAGARPGVNAPTRSRATSARKPAAPRSHARPATAVGEAVAPALPAALPVQPPAPPPERSIADAQSNVAASRFRVESPLRPGQIRTLPSSYGENHLLLLVRDPATLFAAWDMAPSTMEALKARLGRRGYAVSNLTLRLIQAGGPTSVFHLAKRTRSRYFKVTGGPSYIAEIGVTTPSGRFELFARSAPCLVPAGGPAMRPVPPALRRRTVLGYSAARSQTRREAAASRALKASRSREGSQEMPAPAAPVPGTARGSRTESGLARVTAASESARVLGGSSDLYRR